MDKDKLAKSIFDFFMTEDCSELNDEFSAAASDGIDVDINYLREKCRALAEQFIREQPVVGIACGTPDDVPISEHK